MKVTIVFNASTHRVQLPGDEGLRKVETHTAQWSGGDPSHAVAHNFPSRNSAVRALKTYRYAASTQ
jgi:hypothetical protein